MKSLLLNIGKKSKKALYCHLNLKKKNKVLKEYYELIKKNKKRIINENEKDIKNSIKKKLEDNLIKRLALNNNKIEEAQLLVDLKKEQGFKNKFYEKKINYLMGYVNEPDILISEDTILDFHLSHRTNPEFRY